MLAARHTIDYPQAWAHTFPQFAPVQRQLSQHGKLLSGTLEETIVLAPNTRVLIIHTVGHRAAKIDTGALQAPSLLAHSSRPAPSLYYLGL